MVTVSTKKNRVYQRKFDHDEARRLRAAGWTYAALAEHFGVNPTAVSRACDEGVRQKDMEHALAWARRQRQPCLGGCGRLVWRHGTQGKNSSGLCPSCHGKARTTTVRANTLLCTHCGAWKPDADFPSHKGSITRRGRHSLCRTCQTEARREYRERHKVPCANCGKLRLHPRECLAGNRSDSGLCKKCFIDELNGARDEGGRFISVPGPKR